MDTSWIKYCKYLGSDPVKPSRILATPAVYLFLYHKKSIWISTLYKQWAGKDFFCDQVFYSGGFTQNLGILVTDWIKNKILYNDSLGANKQ